MDVTRILSCLLPVVLMAVPVAAWAADRVVSTACCCCPFCCQ